MTPILLQRRRVRQNDDEPPIPCDGVNRPQLKVRQNDDRPNHFRDSADSRLCRPAISSAALGCSREHNPAVNPPQAFSRPATRHSCLTTAFSSGGAPVSYKSQKRIMPRRQMKFLGRGGAGQPSLQAAKNLGLVDLPAAAYCTTRVRCRCPFGFWCCEPRAPPVGSLGLGGVFGPPVGDAPLSFDDRGAIPLGRLCLLPTPPSDAAFFIGRERPQLSPGSHRDSRRRCAPNLSPGANRKTDPTPRGPAPDRD